MMVHTRNEFETYYVRTHRNDNKEVYLRISDQDEQLVGELEAVYTIRQSYKLWKRSPFPLRVLFFFLSFFTGGDLALSPQKKAIRQWILKDAEGNDILSYRKRLRGVSMYQQHKKVGTMVFKRPAFIAKYQTTYQGKSLGKVIPKSIWHQSFVLINEGQLLLKADKRFRNSNKKDMILQVHPSVIMEDLPALLAVFLL